MHTCGAYCSNPNCKTPIDGLEIHHIIPLAIGGDDDESNMIQLCFTCHRYGKLHSCWEMHFDELLIWKMAADFNVQDKNLKSLVDECDSIESLPAFEDAVWIDPVSNQRVFNSWEVKPMKYHKRPKYWKYLRK